MEIEPLILRCCSDGNIASPPPWGLDRKDDPPVNDSAPVRPVILPVILYDGLCGLCNHWVQFVLARDRHDHFQFASIQSSFGIEALRRNGLNSSDLSTVYVLMNDPDRCENLLAKSDAAIFVLRGLEGPWGVIASLFRLIPRFVRDRLYEIVARHRYWAFGRYQACPLPRAEHRRKFIEG